jgi:hypothetical protein
VLVVRHRRKYCAANRLSLTAKEVRAYYQIRHHVEEVVRTAQSHLSLAVLRPTLALVLVEAAR